MARIQILPDQLISKIAAGEVVERPASVVKELLENALDAGARGVEIDLEAGGKRAVRVADDGCGMGRDDALLAFDRHATSKIGSFEDLERVGTLGFRGEALAAIASVARVELLSAVQPGEATRVRVDGGRVVVAEPGARPRGTDVEVRSLFFNVPARRKFVKRPPTELRRSLQVAQGYVLARPDVRFVVRHEGRQLLEAVPVGDDVDGLRERIAQVFGASLSEELVALPQDGVIRGYVGNRRTVRGRRQFIFVNNRLVRDRAVLAIFYRAVRELWKGEDFPALFLFLDLPPEDVDVNVHPQKAEVRFRDPLVLHRVADVLRGGLQQALGEEPAPLGSPGSDFAPVPLAWQGLGGQISSWGKGAIRTSSLPYRGSSPAGGPVVAEGGAAWLPPGRLAEVVYAPLEPSRIPLSGRAGGRESLRLLGQYKGTLILLEGPRGLYLIDQHVAHERVLYERLRRAMAEERTPSQSLLQPALLELGPAEAHALGELSSELERCGFTLGGLSGNAVAVTAVPAVLSIDEAERLLFSLAARAVGEGGDAASASEIESQVLDSLAASQACRSAVKMHHPLAAAEMESLISELFDTEQPYACPHGRPIVLEMSDADLERRFGRR